MLVMECRTFAADFCHFFPRVRDNAYEIHIARGAGNSVELGDDEAAAAMELRLFVKQRVYS
jgi:hypothetical protein